MRDTPDLPDDTDALHALHANWIKRIALMLKARMPWAELDELLQWGAIGMLEAMKRFDPTLGVEFQAFAIRRVRGTMLNGLRREGMLRRGEAMFDPDVVDNAAVKNGSSPEDPLASLLRWMTIAASSRRCARCPSSNTACWRCIFTTR